MKKYFLILILSVIYLDCLSQEFKDSGNIEPKSIFELSINGRKYSITEDENLRLDTLLSNPTFSIKICDYKKFANSSLSFKYPKHLSFEFEQDLAYKNWTLNGNSLVILIFEMNTKITLAHLIDETVKKFGKANCIIEDFQKELGGKKCDGKKIFVTLIGQKVVMECYELKLDDSKSRFIYFQDTLESDKHSKEYEKALDLVNSTITFK